MKKKNEGTDTRGIVEHGEKLTVDRRGKEPHEIKQMENDFARLEEYVDDAIAEQRITYKGKRLSRQDVVLIVKMLVVNRVNKDICEAVNKQRRERGDVELSAAEIGVWRMRGRYKTIILNVRKFVFQSFPDIFEYTNPVYITAKINMVLNYLYELGVKEGVAHGLVDKDTQGLIRLWMLGIRQLNQIIKINVEELEKEEDKAEQVDVLSFMKKMRKNFGSNVTEQEMIDSFFKDRYKKQVEGKTDEKSVDNSNK